MDILATSFITAVVFLSLAFVFQRFENIAGWSLAEVAFLYGMVEAAFGVMDMLFSGFDPQNFGRQVRLGRLDQLLLRPVNLTLQILGSEFIIRRLGRILQGSVILIIALRMLPIDWTFLKVLYMPVVFLSIVMFFGGLFIIGATLTFWTFESIEIINILTYGGAEMISYPMSIYPVGVRRFFTFIIPAIFLLYYPALYILDKPDPFGMPDIVYFMSPLAGIYVLFMGINFWHYGIRHYQSTGT
jgi:ABC-2 type transport system permease protein